MIKSFDEIKLIKGLSKFEVEEKLKKYGYNELPAAKRRNIFKIVFEVFKEPMFILLVSCGVLYLILGDIQEALMLLCFVFLIMGITIYQENKTEKALQSLKDLTSPRALVIRDGEQTRIPGREVVKDDIVIIKEGDRVPADSILMWCLNLSVDESLLTGESVPVRKNQCDGFDKAKFERPGGGDGLPFIYSGSLVVQGQGVAKVVSTGIDTEIGKIGKSLGTIEEEKTTLQKETGNLVKLIFIVAIALCSSVILIYGFLKSNWLEGFLSGITLAMAMLPEEFPVVLTIFLALGAWRLSSKKVLTRRISTVETLGAATVLCVDKTGTLTENKMSIRKIFCNDKFFDVSKKQKTNLPEDFHELVEYGILASKKDPFDPMEKALKELGYSTLYETEHLHDDWPLIEEYPLSNELLALSHVWKCEDEDHYIVSAKGAPEAIMDLCHLDKKEIDKINFNIEIMAKEGLRVLGVAKASFTRRLKLPPKQHDFNFEFIGLIGLADPVRESVPLAVKECYNAGIRVVMITGDNPHTAKNIAEEIGLKNFNMVITGTELEKMSTNELKEKIREVNIFARIIPEQKLKIVNALKDNGDVVAMTGDGVNDAPALKSAHIGVAMGERGTDVARESSGIVLMNDDFSSIVAAVRMGRRIFDNLKKAMAYIISVHVPIAGISLLPVILNLPVILYPVHIVFLELLIDPACSVVFEAEREEDNIMERPPRDPKARLFSYKLLFLSFLQGLFSLVMVFGVYKISLMLGQDEVNARTMSFTTLIVSNLSLILTNRFWSKSILSSFRVNNPALIWVLLGGITFLGMVIYIPFLQGLFHFTFLHLIDIIASVSAGIISIVWFELIKIVFKKLKLEIFN